MFVHLDEENIDEDPIALSTINRSTPLHKIEVIKLQINPDDTLQALALRYRCTVSENYWSMYSTPSQSLTLHNFRYPN